MLSRAYYLLQRDFRELKKNNYEGITAFPISEDMMEWEADIEGLQNTIWHGSFFQLVIHFTLAYNFVPPVVKFKTIPFHPNVDPHTGQPCIDFLDNPHQWNRSYTLSSILLTLQVMLSNPVLENPVNVEAAHILTKDETLYRLIILQLFHQPLSLNDSVQQILGFPCGEKDETTPENTLALSLSCSQLDIILQTFQVPVLPSNQTGELSKLLNHPANEQQVKGDSSEPPEDPDKVIKSVKSISFNDYYKTWSEIATSKATEYYRTPLLEDPNFVGEYYKWKKNEGKHPKECHLKYTAAMARLAREKKRPYKASYPAERSYHCTTPTQTFSDSQTETNTVTKMGVIKERQKRKVLPDDVNTNEPWEEEVASLVAWTNTLDTNALED